MSISASDVLTISGDSVLMSFKDSTGNVGIGITDPTSLLHLSADKDGLGNGPTITLTETTSVSNPITTITNTNGSLYLEADKNNTQSSSSIILRVDNSTVMTLDPTGIDVTGTVEAHEVEIGDGSAGGTSEILFSDNVSARGKILYDHSSNPETMLLQTTGTTAISIDNSQNISIPNGDLDVTGTVTADGLTIDGDIAVNDTTPSLTLSDTGGTNQKFVVSHNGATSYLTFRNDTNYGALQFLADNGTTTALRQSISSNGDINLGYEDTGTTPKLVWDASDESLIIGSGANTYAKLTIATEGTSVGSTIRLVGTNTIAGASQVSHITSYQPTGGAAGDAALDFKVRGGVDTFATPSTVMTLLGGGSAGGSVGIGTNAPQTLLDVEGAANTELLRVGISANENSTLLISPFTAGATNGLQTITSGSQFGTLIQGGLNGKLVLATRDNDGSDSIDFVSGGGDWTADNIYDTTIATFRSDGVAIFPSGIVGIGTPTPATALDVAGTITATGGNSTEWNNAYDVSRKTYTITPPGTTTTFYPIVLTSPDNGTYTHHFTLGEAGEAASDPYNMNALEGWHRGTGWSDIPPGHQMHYSAFDPSEKTILGVYRTVADGYATIIYVRGGETYTITTSSTPTLYSTGWIQGTGPNDIVAMLKDDTGADIAAQADVSQNIQLNIDTFNDGPGLYESHPYHHQGATFEGNVGIGFDSPGEKLVIYENDSSFANTTLLIHNDKADDAAVLT